MWRPRKTLPVGSSSARQPDRQQSLSRGGGRKEQQMKREGGSALSMAKEPADTSVDIEETREREDSWLQGAQEVVSEGSFLAPSFRFLWARKGKLVLCILGILCFLVGFFFFFLKNADGHRNKYHALYFAGGALCSGVAADMVLLLVQWTLDLLVALMGSMSGDAEYHLSWCLFIFAIVRDAFSKLLWTLFVMLGLFFTVPREKGSGQLLSGPIEPEWERPFTIIMRLLGLVALVIASRATSMIARQIISKHFGARSFRPRLKKTFAHEKALALLRGTEPSLHFSTLYNWTARMSLEPDAEVDPSLWQSLQQYTTLKHVDGSDNYNAKSDSFQQTQNTALTKRARPMAIQTFARILLKIDDIHRQRLITDLSSIAATACLPEIVAPPGADREEAEVENTMVGSPDSCVSPQHMPRPPPSTPFTSRRDIAGSSALDAIPETGAMEDLRHSQEAHEKVTPLIDAPLGRIEMDKLHQETHQSKKGLERQKSISRLGTSQARLKDQSLAEDTKMLGSIMLTRGQGSREGKKISRFLNVGRRSSSSSSDTSKDSSAGSNMFAQTAESRVVTRQDFLDAFAVNAATAAELSLWEDLWDTHLDSERSNVMTWQRFRARVLHMFEYRQNLASTILDTQAVVQSLDSLIMAGLMAFVGLLAVAMFSTSENQLTNVAAFASTIAGFSFVFGGSMGESFENAIFLFSMHPYDVGDVLLLGGQRLTVKRIQLFTTDLITIDGFHYRKPNSIMRTEAFTNLSTSDHNSNDFVTLVPASEITADFVQNLHAKLYKCVEMNPDMYKDVDVFLTDVLHPARLQGELSARGTHPTHVEVHFWIDYAFGFVAIDRLLVARTAFICFLSDVLREEGIAKPLVVERERDMT